MMAKPVLDTTGWEAGLNKLAGPMRINLARSMAVAGGKALRDEAIRWAPNGAANESKTPGLLKSSIYLAYKDAKSDSSHVTYGVSWNSKIAPHGHLVEFGHWQPYAVVMHPDGSWSSDKSRPLPSPKWVAAKPFLRPAYNVAKDDAQRAMIARGQSRLKELLAGATDES